MLIPKIVELDSKWALSLLGDLCFLSATVLSIGAPILTAAEVLVAGCSVFDSTRTNKAEAVCMERTSIMLVQPLGDLRGRIQRSV